MERTSFSEYVQKFMPRLGALIELINGKRNNAPTYLHKELLRREYAPDQRWSSASIDTSLVAADMVAMDSPLSPKTRPTVAVASGLLPKIGTMRIMTESQINQIKLMKNQGRPHKEIAAKLEQDPVDCANGIDERNEYNFLKGLSEGVLIVQDADDPSIGLRVDYKYPESHIFGVEELGAISYEDVRRPIEKAEEDGNTISTIFISKALHTKLRQQNWAKELVANYRGQTIVNVSTLPVPTATAFNEAFADDNGGIQFRVIDRQVRFEKNGNRVSKKPFNENRMVYVGDGTQLGALVWSELAEADEARRDTQSTAAIYSIVDQFKLIAKYRTTNPYREYTTGQALVLPVFENVDTYYMLKTDEAGEVDSEKEAADAGDIKLTYKGKTYSKSAVIAALASLGVTVAANATDAAVIKKINKLSDEDEAKLLAAIASAEVSESESASASAS